MRVDYRKAFAEVQAVFSETEIAALTFAIVAIYGWNRLGVGLRSDVMTLDGLDLPAARRAGPRSKTWSDRRLPVPWLAGDGFQIGQDEGAVVAVGDVRGGG